jgi:hypothetical protein
MNTMVISAFPACGKTYLAKNQEALLFNDLGNRKKFTFEDIDSSRYARTPGWETIYADDIEKAIGTVDFIFIARYDEILNELNNRSIPFVVVAPDNSEYITEKERQIIKQQWFGRFLLRDNSHIGDFSGWMRQMIANYDEWTSEENLCRHKPVTFMLLKSDQYISDIIETLYWQKENFTKDYCYSRQ